MWFPGDCESTLNRATTIIASRESKSHLIEILHQIVDAGRTSGGAIPPETFQVYLAGYVELFNEDNPVCDDVSWSSYGFVDEPKLTTELRSRLKSAVRQLNEVLSEVAEELWSSGGHLCRGDRVSL
jgi:hypothetical protein